MRIPKTTPLFAYVAIAALALLQAVVHWDQIGPDGLGYLTIAGFIRAGDWASSISAAWSPLYPVLIAMVWPIVGGARETGAVAAHIITFFAAVLCIIGFAQLMRRLLPPGALAGWPVYFGIAVLTWVVIELSPVRLATPDLLLAGLLLCASAVALHAAERPSLRLQLLLGVLLGLAYLAKTVAWYFAWVQLFIFAIIVWRQRRPRSAMVPILAFLAVALPFVVAISLAKGRVTVGDAGKLSMLWNAHGVPQTHFQGDSVFGFPEHPSRVIYSDPIVYEYATPFTVTYPPSFDPSYWYEGVEAPWSVTKIGARIVDNVSAAVRSFLPLILALLFLLALSWSAGLRSLFATQQLALVLGPAVICTLLYQLTHFEARYLAPLLLLITAALLAPIARARVSARAGWTITFLLAGIVLTPNLLRSARDVAALAGWAEPHDAPYMRETARAVTQYGVRPGEKIGAIGQMYSSYWAYLAGVYIIAEAVPESFWQAGPAKTNCALAAMARAGVSAVVTWYEPPADVASEWKELATGLRIRRVDGATCSSALQAADL